MLFIANLGFLQTCLGSQFFSCLKIMADPSPDPIYLRVLLHFKENFLRHPPLFEDETYLVDNMDFTTMDFAARFEYLEMCIGEPIEKYFYAQHNIPLEVGIRWIEDDTDYMFFLNTVFEEPHEPISLYNYHSGDGLDELYNTDNEESGAVTECDEPGPSNENEHVAEDLVEHPNDVGMEQEIGEEPQV
ncbi:hypothetical protein LXL04_003289 [Taraxacum kok-saghyz]